MLVLLLAMFCLTVSEVSHVQAAEPQAGSEAQARTAGESFSSEPAHNLDVLTNEQGLHEAMELVNTSLRNDVPRDSYTVLLYAKTLEGKQFQDVSAKVVRDVFMMATTLYLITRVFEESVSEQTGAEKIRTQRLLEEQKRMQEQTMDPLEATMLIGLWLGFSPEQHTEALVRCSVVCLSDLDAE